jgi:hypothetical protein
MCYKRKTCKGNNRTALNSLQSKLIWVVYLLKPGFSLVIFKYFFSFQYLKKILISPVNTSNRLSWKRFLDFYCLLLFWFMVCKIYLSTVLHMNVPKYSDLPNNLEANLIIFWKYTYTILLRSVRVLIYE